MKSSVSTYFTIGDCWCAVVLEQNIENQNYNHIALDVAPDDFDRVVQNLQSKGIVEWKENNTEGDSFYFLDPSGNKFEIHSSSLQQRIQEGKTNWGDEVIWYV